MLCFVYVCLRNREKKREKERTRERESGGSEMNKIWRIEVEREIQLLFRIVNRAKRLSESCLNEVMRIDMWEAKVYITIICITFC